MFKTFLIKSLIFVLVMVAIDTAGGYLARYLFFKQTNGKYFRITQTLEKAEADVIVLGSSHAKRHYAPQVFEQTLQKSCFNGGAQGQGVLFNTAVAGVVLERTRPQVLLLNLDEDWLYEFPPSYDRLSELYPYYYRHPQILKKVFDLKSKTEFLQLQSKLFQYNSTFLYALNYSRSKEKAYQGYTEELKVMDSTRVDEISTEKQTDTVAKPIDENFKNTFEQFITQAQSKGCKVVFVVSPKVFELDLSQNQSFQTMKAIAERHDVPFLDFRNSSDFVNHYHLFRDPGHLNHAGAVAFSRQVALAMKPLLNH